MGTVIAEIIGCWSFLFYSKFKFIGLQPWHIFSHAHVTLPLISTSVIRVLPCFVRTTLNRQESSIKSPNVEMGNKWGDHICAIREIVLRKLFVVRDLLRTHIRCPLCPIDWLAGLPGLVWLISTSAVSRDSDNCFHVIVIEWTIKAHLFPGHVWIGAGSFTTRRRYGRRWSAGDDGGDDQWDIILAIYQRHKPADTIPVKIIFTS